MTQTTEHPETLPAGEELDLDDPRLSRFEVVREAARRDGVQIVHYEPQFPVPGTLAERRVARTVALFFLISAVLGLAFLVVYVAWPWEYEPGTNTSKLFTPLLGVTLGIALLAAGFGILTWGKKLLPREIAVQDRHDGASPPQERKLAATTLLYLGEEMGLRRRPLIGVSLAAGLGLIGVAAAAPLIGGLIKNPHRMKGEGGSVGDVLMHTGWASELTNDGEPIRLVRRDGSPIRPDEISIGGQLTAFPGILEGTTNKYADSPTLLIHLRETDAQTLRENLSDVPVNARDGGGMWGNFVAYSKICTHAGCPASLFEQQTNRLLCPCHQSQFLTTENARPVFGPAVRRLPMLPITVDDEGFFVAKSDYAEPVGPAFWELDQS